MRIKWITFSVALLGYSALSYLLFSKLNREKQAQQTHLCIKGSYFEPVKITEFSSQIPCIAIRIGNTTATAKIDLGFCGNISLPSELIEGLDQKSFIRRTFYFGMRGKKYYSDIYELPKIKIGDMTLFQAKVQETNSEFEKDATLLKKEESSSISCLGRIGWPLFHNFNFFLDCENSLIAFCDSLDTLKKQGYPVDSFIETPLLLDRNLIEFKAMTESGPIRCMLDTGSTLNMLNKDIEEGSNNHMILNPDNIDQHPILNSTNSDQMVFEPENVYDMQVFKIGKKDFGAVTFQKIKTPFEIDAIIGMEFLDSKLIFIDFPNRKIYFYEK
jgi:hypothetical protein